MRSLLKFWNQCYSIINSTARIVSSVPFSRQGWMDFTFLRNFVRLKSIIVFTATSLKASPPFVLAKIEKKERKKFPPPTFRSRNLLDRRNQRFIAEERVPLYLPTGDGEAKSHSESGKWWLAFAYWNVDINKGRRLNSSSAQRGSVEDSRNFKQYAEKRNKNGPFHEADEQNRGKGGFARERKKPLKREERSRKLKSLGERSCRV